MFNKRHNINNNDTPDIENTLVSNTNDDRVLRNKHHSTLLIQIAGGMLVLGTAVAVILGSRSVVASMNDKTSAKVASVKQAIVEKEGVAPNKPVTTVVVSDDGSVAKYIKSYDFTTEQLNWAHEHHIVWDDNGNPVDENGFVVDDPTTPVDEIERAKLFNTLEDSGKSKELNIKTYSNYQPDVTNVEKIPEETTTDGENPLKNAIDGDVQPGGAAPSTINKSGAGLG